ncbi:hypothetical protein [Kamptonema formosum]|uniref:hypothetical protein n=1 Tax=Kamptonema formosum TaxID=331992 RepID=UPI0012DDD7F2|nr:hypothetical protein [Oscillatoria sp. PCC 10802]
MTAAPAGRMAVAAVTCAIAVIVSLVKRLGGRGRARDVCGFQSISGCPAPTVQAQLLAVGVGQLRLR